MDIPKQLVVSYVYQLPFGKGHRLGGGHRAVSAVVSGWQFSGIHSYVQGQPLGVVGASCLTPFVGSAALGSTACYANYNRNFNGPVRINGDYGSGDLKGPNPPVFLDINAFANPAPFTIGDTPRSLAFDLRNTPTFNEDFSLRREILIREPFRLSIALDAFNAFNRVRFAAPSINIASGAFGLIGSQANTPRRLQFDIKVNF